MVCQSTVEHAQIVHKMLLLSLTFVKFSDFFHFQMPSVGLSVRRLAVLRRLKCKTIRLKKANRKTASRLKIGASPWFLDTKFLGTKFLGA